MPSGVKSEVRTYQMYINGEWVDSASNKTTAVLDPSTEEVIAQVPAGNAEDVNRAVAAAKAAFDDGSMGIIHAAGARPGPVSSVRKDSPERGQAGGTRMRATAASRSSRRNTTSTTWPPALNTTAGWPRKFSGTVNPVPDNAISLTLKEPMGVAGMITPWNYPLLMATWKMAPALAAGCTCILKPPGVTPLTALELTKWLAGSGPAAGRVERRHRLGIGLRHRAGEASRCEQDRIHRQ